MQKSRRFFLFPVLTLLAILCLTLGVRYFLRPTIGDFYIPRLAGWQREVYKKDKFENVFYTKDGITLSIRWTKVQKRPFPQTTQDLEREELMAQQSMTKLNTLLKRKITDQRLTYQKVSFHGMPALLTEHIVQNHLRKGGRWVPHQVYTKTLRIIKGKNYYVLGANTSLFNAMSPGDREEINRIWPQFTEGLF